MNQSYTTTKRVVANHPVSISIRFPSRSVRPLSPTSWLRMTLCALCTMSCSTAHTMSCSNLMVQNSKS